MKVVIWICMVFHLFFLIVSIIELSPGVHGRLPVLWWLITLTIYFSFLCFAEFYALIVARRRVTPQHKYSLVGHGHQKPPKDWTIDYSWFVTYALLLWIWPTYISISYYSQYKNDGSPHMPQGTDIASVIRWNQLMGWWTMGVPMLSLMWSAMLLMDGVRLMTRTDALVCQRKHQ
jgi:hypothetical protein